MVKVIVNYRRDHDLCCGELLAKGFSQIPRVKLLPKDTTEKADLVVNTLPDNGIIIGKQTVWWDLETAEFQYSQFFNKVDAIFYPNHKNVQVYDPWKHKSYFLPLATDPDYFHYYEVPTEYDVVFVGREDTNRQTRVSGLGALEAHCKAKGYKFLRDNGIPRGEETSKVISSGKLTIQIAGLRNLEQRVFENSPIRPQLVDVQEENEKEMQLIDPGLKSFIPYYYKDGDWSDLLNKVDYYLEHMDEAEKIVEHARKHFFAYNTYEMRARQILDIIGL